MTDLENAIDTMRRAGGVVVEDRASGEFRSRRNHMSIGADELRLLYDAGIVDIFTPHGADTGTLAVLKEA